MAKQICFAGERALFSEPIQRLPQKQGCPLTIVDFLRLPLCCSRNLRLRFCGRLIVQALKNQAAAAFQSSSTITRISDVMFQRTEEKRTKPPLLAVGTRVRASLDEISEKALDQVPRVLGATSLSA